MDKLPDLIPQHDLALIEEIRDVCLTDEARSYDWHGMTAYQIRNFVLKQDCPDAYSQRRQAYRELWARWEAYLQAKYSYEENLIRLAEIEEECARLSRWTWRAKYVRQRLDLESKKLMLAQSMLRVQGERTIREARVVYDVLQGLPRPTATMEQAEHESWLKRAEQHPELKALLPGERPQIGLVRPDGLKLAGGR